jgi:hypothetical protein
VAGQRFHSVGEWATGIPGSAAIADAPADIPEAPVAGRVCQTGIRVLPQVTETIVAYDDATHTLTY